MSAAMQPLKSSRIVNTERLMMIPPGRENLPDLIRLKADERVFGWMLHGTRTPDRTAEELEDDAETIGEDIEVVAPFSMGAAEDAFDEEFARAAQVMEAARSSGHPLQCVSEPVE